MTEANPFRCHAAKCWHSRRLYPYFSFDSMRRPGIFLLPPGWDASPLGRRLLPSILSGCANNSPAHLFIHLNESREKTAMLESSVLSKNTTQ